MAPGSVVEVRIARGDDARGIATLLGQLGYDSTTEEVAYRLRMWDSDQTGHVFVAERAGRVLGVVAMHVVPYLERTGSWCRIVTLVVDESERRAGIGRRLLEAAEVRARRMGCVAVEVTTARGRDEAFAFYRESGFADTTEDAGRFVKELPGLEAVKIRA
jgi:N-acetylglutamate synthase-like GNAT family acetyltransferase